MPFTAGTSPKNFETSRSSMLGRPESRDTVGEDSLTAVWATIRRLQFRL
jgi:hypothetical protein